LGRLRRWFEPPSRGSPPVETLRWTRRVTIGFIPVWILLALQDWVVEGSLHWYWVLLVAGGAWSAVSLRPVIAKAERAPQHPLATPEERRRRMRRALYGVAAFNCAVLTVTGWFTDGAEGAAIFFVFGIALAPISIRWSRRHFEP
jgi:hypothetical protein